MKFFLINLKYSCPGYGDISQTVKPPPRPASMLAAPPSELNRRASESSSESELQNSSRSQNKEKRQGVLSNLFGRRKKPSN